LMRASSKKPKTRKYNTFEEVFGSKSAEKEDQMKKEIQEMQ